jgi:hypothetical protein
VAATKHEEAKASSMARGARWGADLGARWGADLGARCRRKFSSGAWKRSSSRHRGELAVAPTSMGVQGRPGSPRLGVQGDHSKEREAARDGWRRGERGVGVAGRRGMTVGGERVATGMSAADGAVNDVGAAVS